MLAEKIFILRRIQRDIIINIHRFMKNSRYSCHILIKCIFFTDFLKIYRILNLMKIRPVGTEVFDEDGWTERQTGRS